MPSDVASEYTQSDYDSITYQYDLGLAQRYAGKIAVWQIFNEANVYDFKSAQAISTFDSSYLASLADAISNAKSAIKSASPSTLVTANVGGYPVNDALFSEWDQFYDGIKDSIDVLSLDLYPDLNTTEINKFPTRIQNLIDRYGKDVYVAEFGLCTDGSFTEQDQVQALTQSILNFRISAAKAYLVYEIRDEDSSTATVCNNTFGIKKTDGTQKSSYAPVMAAFTATPTPTPTPVPVQGLLRVVTNPAVQATITAVPLAQSWQWGIAWIQFPVGSYFLDVSGINGRTSQRFTIAVQNAQTTQIIYHVATGTIDTQSFVASTPDNTGLLRVATDPATNATLTVTSTTPVITQQWGFAWVPEPPGSYNLTFTYPYSSIYGKPVVIPPQTTIQIQNGKTTVVSADLTTGLVSTSIQ